MYPYSVTLGTWNSFLTLVHYNLQNPLKQFVNNYYKCTLAKRPPAKWTKQALTKSKPGIQNQIQEITFMFRLVLQFYLETSGVTCNIHVI